MQNLALKMGHAQKCEVKGQIQGHQKNSPGGFYLVPQFGFEIPCSVGAIKENDIAAAA